MSEKTRNISGPPFLHFGCGVRSMAFQTMIALAVLAGLYALLYDPSYLLRWSGFVGFAVGLEVLYNLLAEGRLRIRSGSSAVTAALLVMSIPTTTPTLPVCYALILAVFIVRMPNNTGSGLNFNPMLLGRLFLMIAYSSSIVGWTTPGIDTNAVTTATPLELFHSEGALYDIKSLLAGRIGGSWEDWYRLVPGSPGEMFGVLILLLGLLLFRRGILAWRPGVSFVITFLAASAILRQPLLFSLFSGSVLFAAVFIAGAPKSAPVSRGGQWAGGCVAGLVNAYVRSFTFYSEGIVFAFLAANLLTPTFDRIAFNLRGRRLRRLQKRADSHSAAVPQSPDSCKKTARLIRGIAPCK